VIVILILFLLGRRLRFEEHFAERRRGTFLRVLRGRRGEGHGLYRRHGQEIQAKVDQHACAVALRSPTLQRCENSTKTSAFRRTTSATRHVLDAVCD
jgi:hypothetical protein